MAGNATLWHLKLLPLLQSGFLLKLTTGENLDLIAQTTFEKFENEIFSVAMPFLVRKKIVHLCISKCFCSIKHLKGSNIEKTNSKSWKFDWKLGKHFNKTCGQKYRKNTNNVTHRNVYYLTKVFFHLNGESSNLPWLYLYLMNFLLLT